MRRVWGEGGRGFDLTPVYSCVINFSASEEECESKKWKLGSAHAYLERKLSFLLYVRVFLFQTSNVHFT